MQSSLRRPLANVPVQRVYSIPEIRQFAKDQGIVLFTPISGSFASKILGGIKAAFPIENWQPVSSSLHGPLDKVELYEHLVVEPSVGVYLPDTLHAGARDFVINLVNSVSGGALGAVLERLAEIE